MPKKLSILVVECAPKRARQVADTLRRLGEFEVDTISSSKGLARRVTSRDPDLVVIYAGSPSH